MNLYLVSLQYYYLSFTKTLTRMTFPIKGCLKRFLNRRGLREYTEESEIYMFNYHTLLSLCILC
jgi:hypothetical protein